MPLVVAWGSPNEFASVSVTKVIDAALDRVRDLGVANDGDKVVCLHDTDISDDSELDDWVMRLAVVQPPAAAGARAVA